MKKTFLSASILLALTTTSVAEAQEYRMMLNYDFASGNPVSGPGAGGGGGGGSDPAPSTDPGDAQTWRDYASANGLNRMTDPYYGYEFAYLQLENLNSANPPPDENYPSSTVEQIDIENSSALSHVDSLRSVTGVTSTSGSSPLISIRSNPLLENIDGLANISGPAAYKFVIENNDSLTSLQPLSGASLVNESSGKGVSIRQNNSLTSLDGIEGILDSRHPSFPSTNILQSVVITDNPVLSDISALSSLPANSANFSSLLDLSGNAISDITPLSHIVELRDSVYLQDNEIVDASPIATLKLQSYAILDLSNNQITAVNDFSVENLGVGIVVKYSGNPIDDISGLGGFVDSDSNGDTVILDDAVFTTKMSSGSYLCELDGANYRFESVLQKTGGGTFAYSDVCN